MTKKKIYLAVGMIFAVLCAFFVGIKYHAQWQRTALTRYMLRLRQNAESLEKITVAVIDSGCSVDSKYADRISERAWSLVGNQADISDECGHGSLIASLILNNTPDSVKLLPIKVMNAEGIAEVTDIADALSYARDNDADIICLPVNAIVSGEEDIVTGLIDDITGEGIQVIVSAGNTAADVKYLLPANVDSALVVSAVNTDYTPCYFSDYGDTVDFCAYGRFNGEWGTSVAAAYVASIAAELKAYGQDNIEAVFHKYAAPYADNGDDKYGKGYLGVDYAVVQAEEVQTEGDSYTTCSTETEYNLGIGIMDLDWKKTEGGRLNEYFAFTDKEYVGKLLESLSEEERKELKEKSSIFNSTVQIGEYQYDEKTGEYRPESETALNFSEYCIEKYHKMREQMTASAWVTKKDETSFVFTNKGSNGDILDRYVFTISGLRAGVGEASGENVINGNNRITIHRFELKSTTMFNPSIAEFHNYLTDTTTRYSAWYHPNVDVNANPGAIEYSEDHPEYNRKNGADNGNIFYGLSMKFVGLNVDRFGYSYEPDKTVYKYGTALPAVSRQCATLGDTGFVYSEIENARQINLSSSYNTLAGPYFLRSFMGTSEDAYNYNPLGQTGDWAEEHGYQVIDLYHAYRVSDTPSYPNHLGTVTINSSYYELSGLTYVVTDSDYRIAIQNDVAEYIFYEKPYTYQVTYVGWDGESDSHTVNYGENFTLRNNLTAPAGYHFSHYALQRDSDNSIFCTDGQWRSWDSVIGSPNLWCQFRADSTIHNMSGGWTNIHAVPVPGNTYVDTYHLYAQWEADSHVLTVKPNGGTWENSASDQTFTLSCNATKTIANPTRAGYTFNGWSLSGIGSTLSNTTFKMGTTDAALTANWKINTYRQIVQVRYQNADGTWGNYSNVIDKNYEYGSKCSWSRAADKTYQAASVSAYTVTKDNLIQVSIYRNKTTFDLNGWLDGVAHGGLGDFGTVDVYINGRIVGNNVADYYSESILYGSTYEIKDINASIGHTYNGIHTGKLSGTVTGYTAVLLDFTTNYYLLTLNSGTGISAVSGGGRIKYGSSVTVNATMKVGYTWQQWTGTFSTATQNYTFIMPAKDVTLTANATGNTYYVDYAKGSTNHGGTVNRTTHYYNQDVILAENKFIGRSYTLDFNGNKPKDSYGNMTTGVLYNMPSRQSGNLAFSKWSVSATNNSGSYQAAANLGRKNFETTNGATAHATAVWNSKSLSFGKPSLIGYTFTGWYTKASGGTKVDKTVTVIPDTTAYHTTLYAQWVPIKYTVHFDGNGATSGSHSDIVCTYDVPVALTKNAQSSSPFVRTYRAERQGYVFRGWKYSPTKNSADIQDGATIKNLTGTNNATVTLYAHWVDEEKPEITYPECGPGVKVPTPEAPNPGTEVTVNTDNNIEYDWTNSDVYLKFTASDYGSGLESFTLSRKDGTVLETGVISDYTSRIDYTVTTEGITEYILIAKDKTGNTTIISVTVKIDKTLPVGEMNVSYNNIHGVTGHAGMSIFTRIDRKEYKELSVGCEITDWAGAEGAIPSGIKTAKLYIANNDREESREYDMRITGDKLTAEINIDVLTDDFFAGDIGYLIQAWDVAGNKITMSEDFDQITLFTDLSPKFTLDYYRCGEAAILTIVTTGYVDRVVIDFPFEVVGEDNTEFSEFSYDYTYADSDDGIREEKLEFLMPLYAGEKAYTGSEGIRITAYKTGTDQYNPSENLASTRSLCRTEEFILQNSIRDDIRTRLR